MTKILSLCVILFFTLGSGCASLPDRHLLEAQVSPSIDVSTSFLAQSVTSEMDTHPKQSGFLPLNVAVDALAARLALINQAEKTLDLQYYIWHDDFVGLGLFATLLRAADRGVRVRILLDDLDTSGKDELLAKLDSHPNIEIRLYNPFVHRSMRFMDFITRGNRVNHRMHNKAFIADSSVAVIGGRNIGAEYFGAEHVVGFSDMDVLAQGPVINEIQAEFEQYWSNDWVYPISAFIEPPQNVDYLALFHKLLPDEALVEHALYVDAIDAARKRFTDLATMDYSWGFWVFVSDAPGKLSKHELTRETHVAPNLKVAADRAEHEIIIVSPYFVPGKDLTEYLIERVREGLKVRIMTNSLAANDVSMVHAGYRRYRKDLVEGGVELYEFKPEATQAMSKANQDKPLWLGASLSSLHGKFFGFDQRYVFVGSFNLDGRSIHINTEMGVYFESPFYAGLLSEVFDRQAMIMAYKMELDDNGNLLWITYDDGEKTIYTTDPETSAWQRFTNRVLSWIVPEKQL